MCSQLPPMSATCCKKFNSMNILQHCPHSFVAESSPGYMCNVMVSLSMQHKKEVWFACASEDVATALLTQETQNIPSKLLHNKSKIQLWA